MPSAMLPMCVALESTESLSMLVGSSVAETRASTESRPPPMPRNSPRPPSTTGAGTPPEILPWVVSGLGMSAFTPLTRAVAKRCPSPPQPVRGAELRVASTDGDATERLERLVGVDRAVANGLRLRGHAAAFALRRQRRGHRAERCQDEAEPVHASSL